MRTGRWVEKEDGVPPWRHSVWYDGIVLGYAIALFVLIAVVLVFG
jgi:hypothetical protein